MALGDAAPIASAREELARGIKGTLAKEVQQAAAIPADSAIVLGTVARLRDAGAPFVIDRAPGRDGYAIETVKRGAATYTVIAGESDRAVLYGAFAYLRRLALGQVPAEIHDRSTPQAPIRWLNHWDNVDGTIERGYGGRSIFWEGGKVRDDLGAVNDYGRLLASLGINGLSITNVNANPVFLTPEFLPQIAKVADVLRPWGVQVAISVDFASPQKVGKLATYDPLDPGVIKWWKTKVDEIYAAVPDLGGIVLKADSEGRVGPSAYKRTHADAANVIARALKPHGGVFFYRGFVYDHKMDWRNLKNDRARAAYDNFIGLDGRFDDNVIIQIKHGPIDFQVREPASPLFGALKNTNEAIELQITQEYFGQGRHTVFLVPMWKEALDFDMKVKTSSPTPVKAVVSGKVWNTATGGFVGVSNVGRDANWFGNHMSQANLYGFGRLAWDAELSSKQIIDDWTRLTFGTDSKVVDDRQRHPAQVLARVRELHRAARPADAHRHRRQPLRRVGRGVGAERLGPMAPRRRERRRHGSHRQDRHRVHRAVLDGRGRRLRVAQLDAGRSRPVHAPPAVHLPVEVGKDRHPVHLRLALRRRGRGGRLGAQLEDRWKGKWTPSATPPS